MPLRTPYPSPVILSILVPCYNEARTLEHCIHRLLGTHFEDAQLDILIVNDGSKDGSAAIADAIATQYPQQVRSLHHPYNLGKGAALMTGMALARGHIIVVQDADMEYDPEDMARLLAVMRRSGADIMLGNRFPDSEMQNARSFWHAGINHMHTRLFNILSGLNIGDIHTCYKMFRREVLGMFTLHEKRFGADIELVAKVSKLRNRGLTPLLQEMPISYKGRSYQDGKKIKMRDAWYLTYCIFRYTLFK